MSVFPFVLILGPTASGKSALALQLAKQFKGAILNCDSVQSYCRLDIGAAKPSPAEMAMVPHHLFSVLQPGEVLTAGDFRKMALQTLAEELPKRVVFGVGGSGFYIQALEKGMFDVPKPKPEVDRQVREECAAMGLEGMYQELTRLDPDYAVEISPNDSYRIMRALVIIRDSGRRVSELRREFRPTPFPFPLLKLGLNLSREELEPKVRERTAHMLSSGLIDEVRELLQDGFQNWPALQSVGYREVLQYLRGEVDRAQLEHLINEKTLQLAKKQRTWFKRDTEIQWLPVGQPELGASEILRAFLDRAD